MLSTYRICLASMVSIALASLAQSATIGPSSTLTAFRTGPTTYALTVDVAPHDNVLGLASFLGNFRGPPDAANIEWARGILSGFDLVLAKSIGFVTALDPALPQPNQFTFGWTQSLFDSSTHVHGVGLVPVYRDTLPEPIELDAEAYLGTLRFPVGKAYTDYLRDFEVRFFSADGSIGDWTVPNVIITTIPEPATIALTSGALLASGLVLRHRCRADKP
jgi:hypothetical protein